MSERESNIHLARIYLLQARLTKHRNWAFVLLEWAANARRRASNHIVDANKMVGQMDLFA